MPFDGNIVERWSVKGLFGFGYANSKECTLTTVIWAVAAGLLLFQQGRSLMSQTGWIPERPVLPIELEKADMPVFVAPRCQPKNVKAQLKDMLGMQTQYSVSR